MSNLGMSLLTLSDCHNVSEQDIIEPETPRMLDDDLLNFDTHYRDDKDYDMKRLNNLEKQFETGNFTKQKKLNIIQSTMPSTNSRKTSNDNIDKMSSDNRDGKAKSVRPSLMGPTLIKNNSDLGILLQAEKMAEHEYFGAAKSSSGSVRRDCPPSAGLSHKDSKKTFNDFFVNRNRALTDGENVKKATDILRKTLEAGDQPKVTSIYSNNSSIDGRRVVESAFVHNPANEKSTRMSAIRKNTIGETYSAYEGSEYSNDKDFLSALSRKTGRGGEKEPSSPKTEKMSTGGRSYTQKSNVSPDQFLTLKAREILKTKMTHKSISSKYHTELFKMMDSKSKVYDFNDSHMGDSGIYFLSKYIKDNSEIDTLKLDNCKITDDGLSILLHSMASIKIEKLYLRDNLISKEGVENIKRFVQLRSGLHLINLKGNPLDKALMTSYIKEFSHQKVILLV